MHCVLLSSGDAASNILLCLFHKYVFVVSSSRSSSCTHSSCFIFGDHSFFSSSTAHLMRVATIAVPSAGIYIYMCVCVFAVLEIVYVMSWADILAAYLPYFLERSHIFSFHSSTPYCIVPPSPPLFSGKTLQIQLRCSNLPFFHMDSKELPCLSYWIHRGHFFTQTCIPAA